MLCLGESEKTGGNIKPQLSEIPEEKKSEPEGKIDLGVNVWDVVGP